jgi:hypothetical protein
MRFRLWLIAVGLSAAVAGCGGSTKTVIERVPASASATTASTSSTAPATTAPPAGPPPCASTDVAHAHTTGRCKTPAGNVIHYGPKALTLHLKTLSARVENVRSAGTVSNGGSISATASGEYVIVALTITNETDAPEEFDGISAHQTELIANEKSYTEAFKAENEADQQSFVSQSESIQPGESKTGDVIFDLPPAVARKVLAGEKGGLAVLNFGEESSSTASGFGVISLEMKS